jgi:hypothetical protein
MALSYRKITSVLKVPVVLGSIALLVFACSTSKSIYKSSIPPFKIAHTTTSKDLKESGNLSTPVDLSNVFTTKDDKVVSHITFNHLTGEHHLRWDWYGPDKKLYRTTGNHQLNARDGTYVAEGTASHKLALKNTKAANFPGKWKVDIYLDDDLVGTDTFMIKQVAPKKKSDDFAQVDFGNYHALIIGNNQYKSLKELECAKEDAEAMADLLEKRYNFTTDLILDATRSDIILSLDGLRRKLTLNDNLLIYYAGHGWLDTYADEGYWLPVDASEDNSLNWISSSQITASIKAIRAKHVLVIADSCYAGKLIRDITRGIGVTKTKNYFETISKRKARSVLCSGGLEPVADSFGDSGHSVFAAALIDVLNQNKRVMDTTELFSKIRRPVMLNADQTPEYSDIRKAGHEGGEFLFVPTQQETQ